MSDPQREQFAERLKRAYANATGGFRTREPDLILMASDAHETMMAIACDAAAQGKKVMDEEKRIKVGNAFVVKAESLPAGRIIFCKVLHTEN